MKHIMLTTTALLSLATGTAFAQDMPGEGVTVHPVIQPLLEEMFQARVLFRALGGSWL